MASERFSAEKNNGSTEERDILTDAEHKDTGLLERIAREVLPGMRKSGDVDKLAIYTNSLDKDRRWTGLTDGVMDVHRKTRLKGEQEK